MLGKFGIKTVPNVTEMDPKHQLYCNNSHKLCVTSTKPSKHQFYTGRLSTTVTPTTRRPKQSVVTAQEFFDSWRPLLSPLFHFIYWKEVQKPPGTFIGTTCTCAVLPKSVKCSSSDINTLFCKLFTNVRPRHPQLSSTREKLIQKTEDSHREQEEKRWKKVNYDQRVATSWPSLEQQGHLCIYTFKKTVIVVVGCQW